MRELSLRFADVAALHADIAANLGRGRAFVAGAVGVEERTSCVLELVHPTTGATMRLSAEAVYVKPDEPGMGVGLKLDGADRDQLLAFANGTPSAPAPVDAEPAELEIVGPGDEPQELEVVAEEPEPEKEDPAGEEGDDESAGEDERAPGDAGARTLFARIRKLSLVEQQRTARNGALTERIALERAFGPSVWESLLTNTRLSVPEVARIAKKGTLPKPLIEIIAGNGTWLATPDVQRALLSNPRTGGAVLLKVLRALPRADLARVPQQTAYPMAARQAAKKMLKDA